MLSSPLLFIKSTVRRRLMWTMRPARDGIGRSRGRGLAQREIKNLFTEPIADTCRDSAANQDGSSSRV
jgi:hypothetical protein